MKTDEAKYQANVREADLWHPSKIPLSRWPSGWLKLEVAGILKDPAYLVMPDSDKHSRDWPVSDGEMREFILKHKGFVGGREQ